MFGEGKLHCVQGLKKEARGPLKITGFHYYTLSSANPKLIQTMCMKKKMLFHRIVFVLWRAQLSCHYEFKFNRCGSGVRVESSHFVKGDPFASMNI